MMQKKYQWRELLGQYISTVQERQRIADYIGVAPITLTRWASGESNPRLESIRRLLYALSDKRQLLLPSLQEEFREYAASLSSVASETDIPRTISGEFYARVLHTLSITRESLRFASLGDLILQQALKHLDPSRMGMAVIVASCVMPEEGEKVQSLREQLGRGTPPWGSHLEQQGILLGAESLAGQALLTWHLERNPQLGTSSIAPGYRGQWEESAVAMPILHQGKVAGSLLVSSTQPDYFTPDMHQLVEQYAELLALIFDPENFYDWDRIALTIMPTPEQQAPLLATYRTRLMQMMGQAQRNHESLSFIQAERRVWKQIEQEMVRQLL
jgi:transcriptional regulator with XRE-family HTH domain